MFYQCQLNKNLSQHDLSLKHQEWLIKNFKNVEAHTINLDKLFETFEQVYQNLIMNMVWQIQEQDLE